jgi:NADH-quinone oxidoreductase subunit D
MPATMEQAIQDEMRRQIGDVAPKTADAITQTLKINLGPQHPACHGTLRFKLEISGETIVEIEPEIGYLHTGFEKLGEYRTYNQFVVVTDRMNYLSPINNNVGFSIACEELFQVEVPDRGQYARTILCELSRIADHVVSVGLQGMDLGAFSTMLWTFIEREKLYDIFEAVTGARLTTSWTRVGGVFNELPDDFEALVEGFIEKFPGVLDEIEYMLSRNKIFMDRTVGVGTLKKEDVLEYGVTGPVARASGVPYDVRRARPYLVYDRLEWEIPIRTEGDVYARYLVRCAEMRNSVSMVRQALDQMPRRGPLCSPDHKITLPPKEMVYRDMESLIHHFKLIMPGHGLIPPPGEVYSITESPNGELGFYLVSDGTGVPYRVRVRPPSFYQHQTGRLQIKGRMLSDAVAVLSSLNVIAGELDR